MPAQRAQLAGGRWHFAHGPIDLIIAADGEPRAVRAAHEAAWTRFEGVLDELVAELPGLRTAVQQTCSLRGPIARRMWQACHPFRDAFITPMAAVAGSVAQEILAAYQRPGIARAWVNNGGDIALHLAPGQRVDVGLFGDLARFVEPGMAAAGIDGRFSIDASMRVHGVATSGWRGRSFSLGIADSVTVLARTASQADAAATVIANAVDADDARIVRRPANELKDDADLGAIPVTVEVPELGDRVVRQALARGLERAHRLREEDLIVACILLCQNWFASTEHEALYERVDRPDVVPLLASHCSAQA